MLKSTILKYFPKSVNLYGDIKMMWFHRSLKPEKVELPNGMSIYADWHEPRGKGLIKGKAMGQPNIKKWWKYCVETNKPTCVIDVGLNYGEILFHIPYPNETTTIVGVEANPSLFVFLNKSLEAHPDKNKIKLLNKLASSDNSQNIPFYIDKKSSGRSTALEVNFVKDASTTQIDSIRLDEYLINSKSELSRIVFKIDVEGFEPFVLQGMENLWDKAEQTFGCIEFNLVSLTNNSIDVEAYLMKINTFFHTAIFLHDGSIIPLTSLTLENLRQNVPYEILETDILLFSRKESCGELMTHFNSTH